MGGLPTDNGDGTLLLVSVRLVEVMVLLVAFQLEPISGQEAFVGTTDRDLVLSQIWLMLKKLVQW